MGGCFVIWIWAVLFGVIACAFVLVLLATRGEGEVAEIVVDERQIEAEGLVFLERMREEKKQRSNS